MIVNLRSERFCWGFVHCFPFDCADIGTRVKDTCSMGRGDESEETLAREHGNFEESLLPSDGVLICAARYY